MEVTPDGVQVLLLVLLEFACVGSAGLKRNDDFASDLRAWQTFTLQKPPDQTAHGLDAIGTEILRECPDLHRGLGAIHRALQLVGVADLCRIHHWGRIMTPWGQFVNPMGLSAVPLCKPAPWGHAYGAVAAEKITTLEVALLRILERNDKRGTGPTSIRAVAREMTVLRGVGDPTHEQVEQDRRLLRRALTGERGYTEETRRLIAKASRARLAEIPKSPSRAELRRLVVEQARELEELRSALDRSEEQP